MRTTTHPIKSHSREINGKTRAWIEAGTGPLVLLLHGFPDCPQGFLPQIKALAGAGYRAVAPYSRGNAPSFVPEDDDHSPLALATDVLELLDHLGIEQAAAVVGHDWGAVAGYAFAALAPKRLAQLVTLAVPHARSSKPTLIWSSLVLAMQAPAIAAKMASLGKGMLVDQLIKRISPNWNYTPNDVADAKRIMTDASYLKNVTGVYRSLRRWPIQRDASFKLLMKKLTVPTLTFAGVDDSAMPLAHFKKMAVFIDAPFELVELKNVGHFPQRECPDWVNKKLLAFLGTPVAQPARAKRQP
jgi:pimeloyl-ACP methyl ester carboxylesterase